jgi:hypothetical protein
MYVHIVNLEKLIAMSLSTYHYNFFWPSKSHLKLDGLYGKQREKRGGKSFWCPVVQQNYLSFLIILLASLLQ